MKRFLLSLICCSPLLFSPSVSLSVDLTGPSGETFLEFEQYGPVSPTETLWAVSSKLRPDSSVSVQQTMVAIYKTNPYAFFKGDINKIIPESILKVPSLEFVTQQTDKEAIQLIKKYSNNKKSVAKKSPVKSAVKKVEKTVEVAAVEKVDPQVVAENELNKQQLLTAQTALSELQAEMRLLNEQFIIATEATQVLKLKLQPLSDEISVLNEQLASEALIQTKLQKIIDDYRAQLDAVELPPYSEEGTINEILRFITSTATNLMIVILSPVLLLLIIFLAITRIRSKRQLAEQEQELAESTTILMEESGQFDELLTDDFSDDQEQELDFSADQEASNDGEELVVTDELETIDLTEDDVLESIDLTEDDFVTSEDDPFGIGALADDEELISAVDLDDDELQTSEDDPFGIAALSEDEELISSIDLDDDETDEDDPFGIGALSEDDALISAVDLDDDAPISAAEQADLDLAAEWEAQVSADTQENAVKIDDVVDQNESTLDSTAASEDLALDLSEFGIDEDSVDVASTEGGADIEAVGLDLSEFGIDEDSVDVEPAGLDLSEFGIDEASVDVEPTEGVIDTGLETAGLDLSEFGIDEASVDVEPTEDVIDTELDAAGLDLSEFGIDEASVDVEPTEDVIDTELEAAGLDLSEFGIDEASVDVEPMEATLVPENDLPELDLSEFDIEDELPSLVNEPQEDATESESEALDLTHLEGEIELPPLDLTDLDIEDELPLLDIEDLDELAEIEPLELEGELPLLDIEDLDVLTESQQEASDLTEPDTRSELDSIDQLPSDNETELATKEADKEHDILAQQLSDVAFNEEVPLPKIDSTANNDFIDIETLLENSDSNEKEEPYSELNLDLGLDEFPDVVDLQESVDIDDDENGIGAQLDLARAYLEIDDQAGAKEILMSVVEDSNGKQRIEIDKLLSRLT